MMKRAKQRLFRLVGAALFLAACGGPDATAVCNKLCDKIVTCNPGQTADACKAQGKCSTANNNPDMCKNFNDQVSCINSCADKSCDQLLACVQACPTCQK